MKKLFPGHFKDDEQEISEVWKNCIFVFDANILLNLYRYSDATRKDFIKIIEKIRDRIWMPNRAAEEYLANRLTVIGAQEKAYDDTDKAIDTLKSSLENARNTLLLAKK